MRVSPLLNSSAEATYELLAGFLRTFQDKIITCLRNDCIQRQEFHKSFNLLFTDTNYSKQFVANDCASSVVKKHILGRFNCTEDRYARKDCMRSNQFCVRLYKLEGVDKV
jgi:hypothetical protein